MDAIGGGAASNGSAMSMQQAQMNDKLSQQMEAMEGAKVRESMVRSTVKKLTELEQQMRQEEMKSTMKWGEGWIKSLGG